ncbi:MAG: late competence development ComFB family protein [Candidatus Muiribacteriota bacterium]
MKHKLKNVMEILVDEKVRELVKNDKEHSFSQKDILDIIAISLNNLPVKYVVTLEGEAYIKLEFLKLQYKVDIITQVIKAIEHVKKNPREIN